MKHLKSNIMPLLLAATMASGSAHGQTPDTATVATVATATATARILTLDQCVGKALDCNVAIRMSANDLQAAIQQRREAFTKYFPEISAGFSAFKTNHDVLQYNVLDLFTLGIIDKGRAAGIWALQPVFMGGRIVNGNRLAKVGEEAARLRSQQSADDVALQTQLLYWQLATLKSTRLTVESAITMLDSLGREVKAAVDAGIAMNNDYLKVELKRNSFRNSLIDLDNGIGLMKMLLAQQIGMGNDSAIDIAETVPDPVPPYPADIYIDSSTALGMTVDHRLLNKNVEAKQLEKRMTVGNYLPSVGVGAGWVYHNIFNQNHNFAGVMVTVSVPISGWWGGSYAIKRKALEVENAELERDNLSQKLEIEMSDKWDDLMAAYRKMLLASESIAQSAENLRLNRVYYEAGMSTVSDLLDAQTLHQQAQSNYIASYGAFRMARAQYLNATGRGMRSEE